MANISLQDNPYVYGLNHLRASNTAINLYRGEARAYNNPFVIDLDVASVSVNSAVVGANGIDVGGLIASTWYALHVIGDSSGVNDAAGLLSLSATAPALPSGYDSFRRVGWVRTDGSSHFLNYDMNNLGVSAVYYWDVPIAVLTAGAATTSTSVNASAAVPETAALVNMNVAYTPNSQTNILSISVPGFVSSTFPVLISNSAAAVKYTNAVIMLEGQAFLYKVSSASDAATIAVTGYTDVL